MRSLSVFALVVTSCLTQPTEAAVYTPCPIGCPGPSSIRLPRSTDLTPTVPLTAEELAKSHITALLRRVQDQMEMYAPFGGALVLDAALVPNPDEDVPTLRVRGKVLNEGQRLLIQNLFVEQMTQDAYWVEPRPHVSLDLLRVLPPSPALASRYTAIGINAFWNRDYGLADFAFMRAVAEAPGNEVLRYWRVLTAIALCQYDRAEAKLAPLLRNNPLGSHAAPVAFAFERVQGPLRWTLVMLEKRVLLTEVP
jgi:hypothetical protein